MYFQRQEVVGSPPILASFGSICTPDSNKGKLSPTYQLFVGIGYIFYLIVFMSVITIIIQPNEIYSSIYSVENLLKSANWDPDISTPKSSMLFNIKTSQDIQNWMLYVLGPLLLNGHIADQTLVIGASLTKCIGEYKFIDSQINNFIPSDYGAAKFLDTSECKESKINLVSRIANPYKYLEEFFNSSKSYVIQEIEANPTLPKLPIISNRTDIVFYEAEILLYNGNIDTYSVITFSFGLSKFGTYIVEILSQSATPIKKLIGFPCNGNCELDMNQVFKLMLFFGYCLIFILHLLSGIILLISSAIGSPSSSLVDSERTTLGVESWYNYFKERSLSIAIRMSHFSVICMWVVSGTIIQLLPNNKLSEILEKSNETAKQINLNQSSELPLLNTIISTVQISSILRFTGIVIACISTFLMLFRIFQIFSSLFSQINVPLKTMILYFKKIAGIFFLINLIILTLALGSIVYLQIDKYTSVIKGYRTSFTASLFLLLLSPLSSNLWEGDSIETVSKVPNAIFISAILGFVMLYLVLIPLSTATIMFIYNEVEVLQALKQNTDNIYTIKNTLNSWIQQLFFLSTFWQSKKFSLFSDTVRDTTIKISQDSQNEIEAQSLLNNNIQKKEIVKDNESNKIDKLTEHDLGQWFQRKFKQLKKFFEIPPKLEYVPYHLLLLILIFSVLSIIWIVNIINYQLYTDTGEVIWQIFNSPFRARSFYSFDPTLNFSPYMFQNCSKKNSNPPFLYTKEQLDEIPSELLYGLYQSYHLSNITSINHLRTWLEKIFIPLLDVGSSNKTENKFLTDLGITNFFTILNPLLLFIQHFVPVKCNSNPATSNFYLSTLAKSKDIIEVEEIIEFNTTSDTKLFTNLDFDKTEADQIEFFTFRNLFSRIFENRKLEIFQDRNSQLESILSNSGIDRVFFLYAGTESELMNQFYESLNGTDKGNLFWVINSYSTSRGSETHVNFIPSLEKYSSTINANIPYSGIFDYNIDKMVIYLPINISINSSIALITLSFNILPSGRIEISHKFDFMRSEWINFINSKVGVIIDTKKETEVDNSIVESNESDNNNWIFSQILLGTQGIMFVIFASIVIFNFYRKRFLSKRILHQINYKMDVSESETENEENKLNEKPKKFVIKRFSRKIKKKEIERKRVDSETDSDINKNYGITHKNQKKNLIESRRKKLIKKIEEKEIEKNITESNYLFEEEIDDEDILRLYKLSNLNIFCIIIMGLAFFILFFTCVVYYTLIIYTKITINVNLIDLDGGFNSIASYHGTVLPWEVDKSQLHDFDSALNMIGSKSGFYNDYLFSIKNLLVTINKIQQFGHYFSMFELFSALLIIIYICLIFAYSSLLIDRHRRVKILRMRRYLEKTGKKLSGNSFDSLSVFTFMDTTSQRGFSWNDANYAFIPILCVFFSFLFLISLSGYSILGYQENTFFTYYYSVLSSLMVIYNYNSVKRSMLTSNSTNLSLKFTSNFLSYVWKPIFFLLAFFIFNFIIKALIPSSIIFYMRSIASKNLQLSQDTLLSKLNKIAVTRPSIPIFVNDSISLRMRFFIKALYRKLGKFKQLDDSINLMENNLVESEQNERDIKLNKENPDWIFAKLIPELFNEIIHYKLNVAELVNKDQQGIQEIRDYLGNISLQLLLIQEHLVKIEFLRCKLSMIRQELMKIEDVKKDISRGNRESQHYIDRLLQRLMSINDEIEHLDESNRILGQEKEGIKQKSVSSASANYSLQKEKKKYSTEFFFEYDNSYAKTLFENSKINDIIVSSNTDSSEDSKFEDLDFIKDQDSTFNTNSNPKKKSILEFNTNKSIKEERKVKELWKRD